MDTDKRMAGDYEITQSILIGDKEVVFGIDDNNPEHPYLCAFYESNEIIGKYDSCMVGNDLCGTDAPLCQAHHRAMREAAGSRTSCDCAERYNNSGYVCPRKLRGIH